MAARKDTLWGGKRNDTLTGGEGDDTFIFRAGDRHDVITDYAAGDMLKILQANGDAGGSFTKSTFRNGNLTLMISGGGRVTFNNVSAGDTFNINGESHTFNGKSLE